MKKYKISYFIILIFMLLIIMFLAVTNGSINVSFSELVVGMFSREFANVNAIVDLRFPRIIIAILVGAALAVSGLLLQTSLKNPLLDPSILGISSSANFFLHLILVVSPSLVVFKSFVAIFGGLCGYLLIYIFAQKTKSNITIVLIGIALSSLFTGLISAVQLFGGSGNTVVVAKATLGMKSWQDVNLLVLWIPLLLIISFVLARVCNFFFLDDKIIQALGINLVRIRFLISLLAVILASVATSVVGVLTFLGLIVPHISKIIIGKNHIVALPFTALLGAFILLLFDTLGRVIFNPIEIPADIIMLVVGGLFFLIIIVGGKKYE